MRAIDGPINSQRKEKLHKWLFGEFNRFVGGCVLMKSVFIGVQREREREREREAER